MLAVATPVATIAAMFAASPVPRWRRCIIPLVALAIYALALHLFVADEFFPSA